MLIIVSIAAVLLVVLTAAVGLHGRARPRAQAIHDGFERAGQHPAPKPYEPGSGYASGAGATGGGAGLGGAGI